MVQTIKKRRGRKAKYVTDERGNPVVGLARRPSDGRWRVVASGFTFTESDPRLAIARFRQMEAVKAGRAGMVMMPIATVDRNGKLTGSLPPVFPTHDHDHLGGTFLPPGLIVAPQPAPAVNVELQDDGTLNFLGTPVDPAVFGPWLRELILTRKKWVAELTRIENLAHLEDVVAPPASATLVEVGTLYETFADISVDWKRKARSAWSEFCDVVAAPTLRDMTQADVMRYGDFVTGQGKPTSARNKYQAVKAILGLPAKRGQWAEDTARALALCKVLSLPTRAGTDPKPIAPAVFTALLAKADTRTRAVLLLALNCCMYASEVAAMKWSDLDLVNGTLVAKRPKTGVVRIATLWPATVEAVKAIPRITDHVFVSVHGTTLTAKVLSDDFRELRILAKQPDAQFAQIRDGSYTVVCEAGISLDVCRLLAGHKQGGQTDAYVKRSPRMVKPACDAIAAAYGITVVKGSPCWS